MDKIKNIINIILIVILVGSVGWFLINQSGAPKLDHNTEIKSIDITPVITGITSIILFLLKSFYFKPKKKTKNNKELSDHPIFNDIQTIRDYDLDKMAFGSEGRTEMFRIMLGEILNSYNENLLTFIQDNKTFESSADFRKKCRTLILNITADYEDKWIKFNIPQVVIDKYLKLLNDRIKMLIADIDTITFGADNYEEALYQLFYEMRTTLRLIFLSDSIEVSSKLNGELNNTTFNGKKL